MLPAHSHCPYEKEATISLFRRGQWYRSMDRISTCSCRDIYVCLAPELILLDDLHNFRVNIGNTKSPLRDRRISILAEALQMFSEGEVYIDGLGPQTALEFGELMAQHRGLPLGIVRRWSTLLLGHLEETAKKPTHQDNQELGIVVLPSNTFTSLESCIDAVADGFAIWIRPSRKEPFAAARFVACLLLAGFPADRLGLYPMERQTLASVVKYFDKATIYGGNDVMKVFGNWPNVEMRGPGRAMAFVRSDVDISEIAKWLCERIVSDCGRFCTNVKTIFCVHSHHELSEELSSLLDQLRVDDASESPGWWPDCGEAQAMAKWVRAGVGPQDRIMTKRQLLQEINGKTYLMPSLIFVDQPAAHPLLKRELPFPYATISQITTSEVDRFTANSNYIYNLNINSPMLPQPLRPTGL